MPSLRLQCLIEHEYILFPITVECDAVVGNLKSEIKKQRPISFERVDARRLELWKPKDDIDTEPDETLNERIEYLGHDFSKFADKLCPTKTVSSIFPTQPPKNYVHIIVRAPRIGIGPSVSNKSNASSISDPWLHELHSKIWRRQDLRSEVFRKVKVTAAHYHALQKRLKERHPDRDLPNYDASGNNVLSVKLEILHQAIPASAPSQQAHSGNEQILVQDDEGLEESDGNDDAEFTSFLPATLEFLDLSSLKLKKQPTRLPLPLFLREEYSLISRLLENGSKRSNGSAIVSGQPGTGKTAFLYLMMIEYMISGRAFLYQTIDGVVYHVSEHITKIKSWSPDTDEPIVAFVDADSESGAPNQFLRYRFVKIIAASSPGGTDQKWLTQGDVGTFVTKFGADLWSPSELFLTGIFLHPLDLTFRRLKESVSYFGYNPRLCFLASQSKSKLLQLGEQIQNKISCIPPDTGILTLMYGAFMTRGVSHSVFELKPSDDARLLPCCQIGAVSPWALDALLTEYETRTADAAADFYISITNKPFAASLRDRLMERQVLKYFDTFPGPHDFPMRSLDGSAVSTWTYPGPAKRVTFESQSFTPSLTSAVEAKQAQHLVPSDPNFPAIDSILYNPAEGLVCIQITTKRNHPVAVSGLERIQSWLKRGTPLGDLRPSISGKHWRLVFVVPEVMASDYRLQDFEGDTKECEWANKVDQYVVGINENIVWGRAMPTS